jgi:alpha-glucosidase
MFIRAGGFVFRQPVVQSTDEMPGNPLEVLVAPAKESESDLYEDDGQTLAYRDGQFMKRHFQQTNNGRRTTIEISAPRGAYRPAKRDLILELWTDGKPRSVQLEAGEQKIAMSELTSDAMTNAPSGWTFDGGLLTVKSPDSFAPMRLTIRND